MKTISRIAFALAFSAFVVQAHANQAQQTSARITPKYAKSLVSKAASQQGRWHKWKVTLGSETTGLVSAQAKPDFGRGPVIMTATGSNGAQNTSLIFVPSYHGTVDMAKGPGAPKGLKRVLLQQTPIPFNAATP